MGSCACGCDESGLDIDVPHDYLCNTAIKWKNLCLHATLGMQVLLKLPEILFPQLVLLHQLALFHFHSHGDIHARPAGQPCTYVMCSTKASDGACVRGGEVLHQAECGTKVGVEFGSVLCNS